MPSGNILIVDDETHISEMLKIRLEANDFSVQCADSALEALRILERGPEIDVVMSDIMMPGLDGIELMRQVKEKYPDKEVILITGFASLETAIEAVRLGGFDYIKKPFEDIPALLRTVKSAVGKKRLVAETQKLTEELKASNDNLRRINLMLGDNVNELVMLHHIVESISGTSSIEEIIDKFLENIVEALDFRKAAFFLKNDTHDILELCGDIGFKDNPLGIITVSLEDKTSDIIKALFSREPLIISGFKKDYGDEVFRKISQQDSHSIILFPLRVREDPIGILVMESDKQMPARKLHSVELYINQAALIIANARMFQKLVKINEDLKEMDKLKSEFISTVSHELRTPLTTVKEGISIVLEGIVGEINERQERLLSIFKKDVDRLSKLIEDLLNISRIEAGKISLERSRFSLNEVIERALLSVRVPAQARMIEIKKICPDNLPLIYADENKIIQVLVNLLANAIRFSPEKGIIAVRAEAVIGGEFIEVDIKDEGIGIAEEDKKKLFQKFSQISREYGAGTKGTGLGLAISKELITMHTGRIWLKESSPGKGSTFAFTLLVYRPGVEEKTMVNDELNSEVRKAHKSKTVFSIAAFINSGKIDKEKFLRLKGILTKELNSDDDCIGLYSDNLILAVLSGVNNFSAAAWKDRVLNNLPEDCRDKIKCLVVSCPENGESKEELLKKVMSG